MENQDVAFQQTLVYVPNESTKETIRQVKGCFKGISCVRFRTFDQLHMTLLGMSVESDERGNYKGSRNGSEFNGDVLLKLLQKHLIEDPKRKFELIVKDSIPFSDPKYYDSSRKRTNYNTAVVTNNDKRIYYGFGNLTFVTEAKGGWLRKFREEFKGAGIIFKYPQFQNQLHSTLGSVDFEGGKIGDELRRKLEAAMCEACKILTKKKVLEFSPRSVFMVQYKNDEKNLKEIVKLDRTRGDEVSYIDIDTYLKIPSVEELYRKKYGTL